MVARSCPYLIKHRYILIYFLSIVLILCVNPSYGVEEGDVLTVQASGQAVIKKGDVEGAKKKAILNAKRNAVEQVGTRIISRTVVENFILVKDKIISKADGYVHNYTILKEKQSGGSYLVEMEAQVSKSSLVEDALSLYHDMNKPRVMVILPEIRENNVIPMSHAENIVSEFFVNKEFTLIDPVIVKDKIRKDEMRKLAEGDQIAAAKIGLDAGAEVVVAGTATVGNVQSVRDVMYSSKATCSARAIKTGNASLYALSSASKSAADGIAEGAQRKSIESSCTSIAKDIFWKIVKKWNDELMTGRDVEIVLSGVGFSRLKEVIKALREFEEVTEVVQRSFDSPMAVLTVTYKGDAMELAETIDERKFEGFELEVLTVSSGKINIKVQ